MEKPQLHISQRSELAPKIAFPTRPVTCRCLMITESLVQHSKPIRTSEGHTRVSLSLSLYLSPHVCHSLNRIFHLTLRPVVKPIRSQLVSAASAKLESRDCAGEIQGKTGSAPKPSHLPLASLTSGSSFWRAVNCNRCQTSCSENREAGTASSIHWVTEGCLNCRSSFKLVHSCST